MFSTPSVLSFTQLGQVDAVSLLHRLQHVAHVWHLRALLGDALQARFARHESLILAQVICLRFPCSEHSRTARALCLRSSRTV